MAYGVQVTQVHLLKHTIAESRTTHKCKGKCKGNQTHTAVRVKEITQLCCTDLRICEHAPFTKIKSDLFNKVKCLGVQLWHRIPKPADAFTEINSEWQITI